MGKRGPPKKPTRLRVLQGNPSKRPLPKHEPQPRATRRLDPPSHLSKSAKQAWRRIAPKLHRLGLLTELDTDALAMYCDARARWLDAKDHVDELGPIVKTKKTEAPIQNPYVAIANRAFEDLRKLAADFGMTPAARTGVEAFEVPDIDPMEEFLKRGGAVGPAVE